MHTGLIGLSPFIAALLIVIFLSIGLSKVSKASTINKFLAIPWGVYIFVLSLANENTLAVFISSLFQIFFVYWYLQILYRLEGKIVIYLFFLVLGAFILSFLNSLVYILFATLLI